jgi:cell division protease FtsH
MSDKLGPLQYEEQSEGYLGMGQAQRTFRSGSTNELIDNEIKGLVEGAHKRATDLLTTHEDQLHLLAQALLEYETLTGEEIRALLEDGKIDRPDAPRGPTVAVPVRGSAIPKAGKRFGGKSDEAPQGA